MTLYKAIRCLCCLLFLFVFASCSLQRKISRSAEKVVLQDSSLRTAHVGISIYEPETGKYWYNYQGDKYFVPASNTKIPTCYAAMKYLGDSLVAFRYLTDGNSIAIVPSGDPTFLHRDFSSARALEFLKSFGQVGLVQVSNNFGYYGSGWSGDDYLATYMTERSEFPIYGNVVTLTIDSPSIQIYPRYFQQDVFPTREDHKGWKGIEVERSKEANNFNVSEGTNKTITVPFHTREFGNRNITMRHWREMLSDTIKRPVTQFVFGQTPVLKKFHSIRTDSLLKPMMHHSDNFFAEQALLMVSNEFLGRMDDKRIIDTLLKTDFKDLPQQPQWVDGSGLSRYNLFTPQSLIFILNKMKNEFGMDRIKEIFPTGGEGTISSYYKQDSTFIYAKTGTLSGVVALSGYLYTNKGRLLIFSTLVNNHQGSATAVRKALEMFIRQLRKNF